MASTDTAAVTFPSVAHASPSNTSTVISCDILGGQLWIGSFLKLTGNRIVRYVDNAPSSHEAERKLIGNLFVTYEGAELELSANNYYLKGLKGREIMQTLDSNLFTLDEISDIAFVFSVDHINSNGLMLHGISNAYLCRYCKLDNNTTVPINILSFPCKFPGYSLWGPSFPKHVWTSIQTLQKTFRQLLSVKSEKQGFYVPNKKKAILFQVEVWQYIAMCFSFVDVVVSTTKRSTIGHKLLSGFSRVSVRQVEDAELLIVSTPQQLRLLQQILGTFVLFGSCFSRPKLGTIAHLHENCSMNVVAGVLSDDASTTESHFYPTKIQFTMCSTSSELIVSVSYGLYLYKTNPLSGEPVNCPSTSLGNLIMNFRSPAMTAIQETQQHPIDAVSVSVIRPGRRFTRDGIVYKVVVIDGGDVVCRPTGGDVPSPGISVCFPILEVVDRILARAKANTMTAVSVGNST